MQQNILVTGGAGNIGTHTLLQLLLAGYKVDVVDRDNFSDVAIQGVRELAGEHAANLSFHKLDLMDRPALQKLFSSTKFDSVLHFAGLKPVGETMVSIDDRCLVHGTIILLQVMEAHGCRKLVFSSSVTVDGCGQKWTYRKPTRHYIEETCRQKYKNYDDWKVILLRYFNPVGAHPSGHIGEDPRAIPKDLVPFVKQVAVGSRPALITVDGIDYSTKDGTGEVRDYIHVIDLADGHIATVRKLDESGVGCEVYSLGKGTSVLEMVDKEACHRAREERKAKFRESIKILGFTSLWHNQTFYDLVITEEARASSAIPRKSKSAAGPSTSESSAVPSTSKSAAGPGKSKSSAIPRKSKSAVPRKSKRANQAQVIEISD